jgi:hypothetical protein
MLFLFALVLAAANDDVDALKAAAKEAAADERYCDAHGYFQALFARTGELKHLYNAAEVARVAKDNVAALAAYRAVALRAPNDFPERDRVARVVAELEATVTSGDLGTSCTPPPPLPPVVQEPVPPKSVEAPAPAPSPAPVVEESATPTLVIVGGVIAGAGAVAAIGFGVWAAVLESQLRTRAPDVTPEEKDAALSAGWPIVIGASAGVVAAGVGGALVVMGLE